MGVRIFCDRCGMEMKQPQYSKSYEEQGYVLIRMGSNEQFHLCPNCGDRAKAKITIRSHVEDFLENFNHKDKENNKDGN